MDTLGAHSFLPKYMKLLFSLLESWKGLEKYSKVYSLKDCLTSTFPRSKISLKEVKKRRGAKRDLRGSKTFTRKVKQKGSPCKENLPTLWLVRIACARLKFRSH